MRKKRQLSLRRNLQMRRHLTGTAPASDIDPGSGEDYFPAISPMQRAVRSIPCLDANEGRRK
jgi:hypothetical protein